MHELGIVFHAIDRVAEVVKENDVKKVSKVTLEVGEVSGVVHEYLTDCWKWAVNSAKAKCDALRGSVLEIETLPAVTICNACQKTYPTVEFGKTCPHCKSEDTVLLRGTEMNIKEIEAE